MDSIIIIIGKGKKGKLSMPDITPQRQKEAMEVTLHAFLNPGSRWRCSDYSRPQNKSRHAGTCPGFPFGRGDHVKKMFKSSQKTTEELHFSFFLRKHHIYHEADIPWSVHDRTFHT
jgi:hypothetical protein